MNRSTAFGEIKFLELKLQKLETKVNNLKNGVINELISITGNGLSVIEIDDCREWEPGKCNNGGAYSFTRCYQKSATDHHDWWSVVHSDSSDYSCCKHCGGLHDEDQCAPRHVTSAELAEIVQFAFETDNMFVSTIK